MFYVNVLLPQKDKERSFPEKGIRPPTETSCKLNFDIDSLVAAHANNTTTVPSGCRGLDDWLGDVDLDVVEAHGAEHVLGVGVNVEGNSLGVETVENARLVY